MRLAGLVLAFRATKRATRATKHPQMWIFRISSEIFLSNLKNPQTRINKGKTGECSKLASLRFFSLKAGLPGFEPGNDGVRVRCLTVWR